MLVFSDERLLVPILSPQPDVSISEQEVSSPGGSPVSVCAIQEVHTTYLFISGLNESLPLWGLSWRSSNRQHSLIRLTYSLPFLKFIIWYNAEKRRWNPLNILTSGQCGVFTHYPCHPFIHLANTYEYLICQAARQELVSPLMEYII